ncbi:MAG: winged helix-turn-helix domain-containing protein [Proteobacteria bacterium]|nr:winged helix-turn-helix domain-containing protein [Pseudomonadota bacterium]
MTRPAPERPFVLGNWTIDPAQGTIARDGKETRLEPQAMALLLLFAASPQRVIKKDEIVSAVWNGRAIGDDTLASAISKLRAVLGESESKRYIETLPKRGYRLLVIPDDMAPVAAAPKSEVEKLIARGHAMLKTPLPQNLNQARVYFEGALKGDAKSAPAHCGLAETMLTQHLMGQGRELVAAAKAAALAATALDETLAQAWSILGYTLLLNDRDFAAADSVLRKAIALDPMLVSAYRCRAYGFVAVGRFVEAERAARAAAEIEPLSLSARNDLLQILLVARRYAQAIAEAKRILAFNREASEGVMFVARPTDIAYLRTAAGQVDAAFAALNKAAERDDPYLIALPYLPYLDRLRNDARFVRLAERVQLVR